MVDYSPPHESNSGVAQLIREARQLALDELFRSSQTEQSITIDRAFPEEFVNQLSSQEVFNKHLFRPNTYLHKWWARRCGTTFRAILKQFVPDEGRIDYYTPGGLEGKVVLDPMMGGGTTLHEAIRLGANVIGADLDPIPIVQARAALTQVTPAALRKTFTDLFSELHTTLRHYFQTECPTCQKTVDSQYTLHGIRKACACCEIVQIDQFVLRQEAEKEIRICPDSWEITCDLSKPRAAARTPRLVSKGERKCPSCGQQYEELLDLPFYARYVPIAIFARCGEHGLFFRSPSKADQARLNQAEGKRSTLEFGPLEDFRVNGGPKSRDLLKRNIRSYIDVFSSRQLLYLHQAIHLLAQYNDATRLNMGILVSASLEFNSMLCGYKGWGKNRPGAIRHVFALHAYSFQYTALENNPINPRKASGNLQLLFRDRIERGRKWAALPIERRIGKDGKNELVEIPGEVDGGVEVSNQVDLKSERQKFMLIQGDSQSLPIESQSVDLVVTDPPYYDSVQYSDLAAFFRVWLARMLPGEVEWTYDETQSAVATKASKKNSTYMAVLAGIFVECGRVLKRPFGRMVFTFHHWDPNAWAELTIALKNARFRLTATYIVHSEHPISVHIRNLNSIKHDSILVLALDSSCPPVPWIPIEVIDTSDSESFCRQCSETLGWLLESALSSAEIRAIWKKLIRD